MTPEEAESLGFHKDLEGRWIMWILCSGRRFAVSESELSQIAAYEVRPSRDKMRKALRDLVEPPRWIYRKDHEMIDPKIDEISIDGGNYWQSCSGIAFETVLGNLRARYESPEHCHWLRCKTRTDIDLPPSAYFLNPEQPLAVGDVYSSCSFPDMKALTQRDLTKPLSHYGWSVAADQHVGMIPSTLGIRWVVRGLALKS